MISASLWAGAILVATVAVGIVVHESLHAVILRASGIECTVELLPGSSRAGGFETLLSGSFASVVMTSIPATCSLWRLRLAALAPLTMLVPVGLYAWLATTGPATESLLASMVVIGWMACALPSPADFSIVWHTEEARDMLPESSDTGC